MQHCLHTRQCKSLIYKLTNRLEVKLDPDTWSGQPYVILRITLNSCHPNTASSSLGAVMEPPIFCGQELTGPPQSHGTDTGSQSLHTQSDAGSFFDMKITDDDQISFITLSRILSKTSSFSSVKKGFLTNAFGLFKPLTKKYKKDGEIHHVLHSPRCTDSADNPTAANEPFEEIHELEAKDARQVFAQNEPFENITEHEASAIKAEEQIDIYVARKAISGLMRAAEEVMESTKETLTSAKDAAFNRIRSLRTVYTFHGMEWAYVPTPEEAKCECYWHGDGWKFCSVRDGVKPFSPHYSDKCKELGLSTGM
ncbi:uncharacterized protein K452DRAFT_305603 [Aplosporella prunicola CBS 121167]|uniref:Uncharacterized protein n=1 Tax=Aplosporella prunicola CBS 121167 TaxID=1176127 RepID=A0A6A6BNF9_9PEZI|nr:uncharacterized protein K452DRAFT_305603 [Aplosporella prunicola CBS 121167]KAF2145616.1 hypothetical protein K452DRAFT_305603 [Aplosporella prunicola CBS 121167]